MHSHQNNISEKQAHIIIIKLTSIEIIVVNQIEITQPTKEYKLVTYFSVGHMYVTKYNQGVLLGTNYSMPQTMTMSMMKQKFISLTDWLNSPLNLPHILQLINTEISSIKIPLSFKTFYCQDQEYVVFAGTTSSPFFSLCFSFFFNLT